MLAHIHNKRLWQIFMAGAISLLPFINTRPVFFNISLFFGKLVLDSYNKS